MKLTLIGNGIMAQSLAKGLVKNYEVEMIGRDIDKLRQVKEKIPEVSIKIIDDQEDITDKNILFCVKPYALQSVAVRLTGKANTLYSILAGTKLESLKKQISAKYYIRTMPNVAASVSMSMTTITGDNEAKMSALEIFNAIGKTVWVNTEKQLDIATAIAGCGPAYLAIIAEAIADGAVKAGLERHISTELVHGLFVGTSALLAKTHPAILKDSVMSPGGTTAAGVGAIEEGNVRNSMIKAIQAAYEKAEELGSK
ncbi:pyrroline-5-carboxylate reductase [Malaciobacter molluscorum LMG 25693]|uniref:Pyrroline-5-carboxylate reductase n=1 Tax=Malaciobacter molluscorum LMG 25693 TaxID=870501 RepID=A0A2G1DJN3_9BACT|nr:pyrroline-5-carboxylate reductase [Malaciobacter molluscorum]AXX91649.1 pyrroline-5-carboxylate reductase [Malaciobacter molluscorum LMG 25693]PHO18556.1 pyrroline-5-carboxylate reductase [Malaciobacter molluscorum LMG 25693]